MEEEKCIVCQESSTRGLKVRQNLICSRCEEDIVLAEVSDAGYEKFKVDLKKLWVGVPLGERQG